MKFKSSFISTYYTKVPWLKAQSVAPSLHVVRYACTFYFSTWVIAVVPITCKDKTLRIPLRCLKASPCWPTLSKQTGAKTTAFKSGCICDIISSVSQRMSLWIAWVSHPAHRLSPRVLGVWKGGNPQKPHVPLHALEQWDHGTHKYTHIHMRPPLLWCCTQPLSDPWPVSK